MSVGTANLAIEEGVVRICSGGIAGQLQFGWDCHLTPKKAVRRSGEGQFFLEPGKWVVSVGGSRKLVLLGLVYERCASVYFVGICCGCVKRGGHNDDWKVECWEEGLCKSVVVAPPKLQVDGPQFVQHVGNGGFHNVDTVRPSCTQCNPPKKKRTPKPPPKG